MPNPKLTDEQGAEFVRLFRHWASSDVQMELHPGMEASSTEHQFIAFLLQHREAIIVAVCESIPLNK